MCLGLANGYIEEKGNEIRDGERRRGSQDYQETRYKSVKGFCKHHFHHE